MGNMNRIHKHKTISRRQSPELAVRDLKEETSGGAKKEECFWVVDGLQALCIPPIGNEGHVARGWSLWVDTTHATSVQEPG